MSDTEMATSKKKKSKKEKKDAVEVAADAVAIETDEAVAVAAEIEPAIAAIASPLAVSRTSERASVDGGACTRMRYRRLRIGVLTVSAAAAARLLTRFP
jgi:3-dehydroquinate dehydratase